MATYKVLQDIEAEDKLLGPLTLRQFIYAGICVALLYLAFLTATKGLIVVSPIFVLPAFLFGFLAFPWKGEQPTEVWALAKIRFLVKPRKRIWNQSGVKELVTITVPKVFEQNLTNGLSETEVRSRLKALASTIDSRGWVVKNVGASTYGQPGFFPQAAANSDRLLGITTLPQPVVDQSQDAEDVLDQNNPVARQFDSMIAASAKAHRQEIVDRLRDNPAPQPRPAVAPKPPVPQTPTNDYWFLNQPAQGGSSVPQDAVTFNTQVVTPGATASALPVTAATPTADEEAFIKTLPSEPAFTKNMHGHLHVIEPLSAQRAGAQRAAQTTVPTPPPKVTPTPNPAIVELARNDDLNVATIARVAQKRNEPPDEVVISLR